MLYITTRSKTDSYTAHRALRDGFSSDGGHFTPMRLPQFSNVQIESFSNKSFCDVIAEVLNVFFSKNLTGWDIEFAIGRNPVRISELSGKIYVAETWRNTESSFEISIDRIYNLLCNTDYGDSRAKGWARIAIRIAFLCGMYGQLVQIGIYNFDISFAGKGFEAVISAWYAREMGLPIGNIICGSNENSGIWDLLNKQQINFGSQIVNTDTPDMDDIAPAGLERLVYETLGLQESIRYTSSAENKTFYQVQPGCVDKLSDKLFSSVVGKKRVCDIISSVYKTNDYFIDPYMSVAYGALQDYRAKFGENRITLLWSEVNPSKHAKLIAKNTGVAEGEIINR